MGEGRSCEVKWNSAALLPGGSESKLARKIGVSFPKYEGKTVFAASGEEGSIEGTKLFFVESVALAGVIVILALGKWLKTVHILLTPALFPLCQRLEIRNRTKMRQAKT
jgi:hypothetical protein